MNQCLTNSYHSSLFCDHITANAVSFFKFANDRFKICNKDVLSIGYLNKHTNQQYVTEAIVVLFSQGISQVACTYWRSILVNLSLYKQLIYFAIT